MERSAPHKGNDPYIFISYSHRDNDKVLHVIQLLQNRGFRVWYDDGINPGAEWDDDIARHITECTWFFAFITKAYLASDNCRDELFYARKLSKRRLLIYLEEVELPAAMDMRMNRLQAIFWNRYRTEADAMTKLLETEELELCRNPQTEGTAHVDAPSTSAEFPAQSMQNTQAVSASVESQQSSPGDTLPAHTLSSQTPDDNIGETSNSQVGAIVVDHPIGNVRSKESNSLKRFKKRPAIGIIAILLVVIIGAASAIWLSASESAISAKDEGTGSADVGEPNASASLPDTETGTSSAEMPIDTEMGALLYGMHMYESDLLEYAQKSSTEYQFLETPDGDFEMTMLPVALAASPDYPGYSLAVFADRFGTEYSFYCAYSLKNGVLTLSSGAPNNLNGLLDLFDAADAMPLQSELTYEFHLDTGDYSICANDKRLNLTSAETVLKGKVILAGSASDPEHLFNNILSIDATIDCASETCVSGPELGMADGGHTTDAAIDGLWLNISRISFAWSNEERPYNGRDENFEVSGYSDIFGYYSTTPYGFVVNYDGAYYFYQNTLE